MPLKTRAKVPRDSVSDMYHKKSSMDQLDEGSSSNATQLRSIHDFLEKCGMSHATLSDRVIGELEAMAMVSSFRDTDIHEIDASDRAVRFLQGKRISTVWRSVSREALYLTMSDNDSSRQTPSQSTEETDYSLPHLNALLSQSAIQSDRDDDDVDDVFDGDQTARSADVSEWEQDDEEKISRECVFALGRPVNETKKRTNAVSSRTHTPLGRPRVNFEETNSSPSELYTFFDDSHSDYESSVGGHHHFLSFGYMSAGFDSDSDATPRTFGASTSTICTSTIRRVIKPSEVFFVERARLHKTLSSDHLMISPPRRKDRGALGTSSAFSRIGVRATPSAAPRRGPPPRARTANAATATRTTPKPTTNLVKAHSAHNIAGGRRDTTAGSFSPDALVSRLGALHLSVPDHASGLDSETRLDSFMSNTSYMLYDSDDTPPPPDCNIAPELFVQSNRSKWH